MSAKSYSISLLVDQSEAEVFSAINHVRRWWSEEIEGRTDKLGEEWTYRYQEIHRCRLKIVEWVPNRRVVWQVLENHFNFAHDPTEWIGNRMIFEISRQGNQTKLQFTQEGLVPAYECFDICQGAWDTYIGQSLRLLIETGKGQPNARETRRETDAVSSRHFTTSFEVTQTPAEVFNAINQVGAWWQGEVVGSSQKLNDEFTYRMLDIHYSRQRVVELVPDKKVLWLVTDSKLSSFGDDGEWTGTTIMFEIEAKNGKTQLRFTHQGLLPSCQCYGDCSGAWEMLVNEALYSLITTGKAKKVF